MFDFITNIFISILNILPDLDFVIPTGVEDTFYNFIGVAFYFFPIRELLPIIFFGLTLKLIALINIIKVKIVSFIRG